MNQNDRPAPFFAELSHGVRQPLNGVLERLRDLQGRDMAQCPRGVRGLAEMELRVLELLSLVNDILDLVRLEEGNFQLAPASFDLRRLVENLRDDLGGVLDAACLQFDCLCHPELPGVVFGDAGRLRQALVDLSHFWDGVRRQGQAWLAVDAPDSHRVRFVLRGPGWSRRAARAQDFVAYLRGGESEPTLWEEPTAAEIRVGLAARLAEAMGGELRIDHPDDEAILTLTVPLRSSRHLVDETPVAAGAAAWHAVVVAETDVAAEPWLAALREAGAAAESTAAFADVPTLLAGSSAAPDSRLVVMLTHRNTQAAEDLGRRIARDDALSKTRLAYVATVGRRGDAARLREIGFAAYLLLPLTPEDIQDAAALLLTREPEFFTRHQLREWRGAAESTEAVARVRIDWAARRYTFGGDQNALGEALNEFRREYEAGLADLQAALFDDDRDGARGAAVALAEAAGRLEFPVLVEFAEALVADLDASHLDHAAAGARRLARAFNGLRADLEKGR